jgi:hypothetical protein
VQTWQGGKGKAVRSKVCWCCWKGKRYQVRLIARQLPPEVAEAARQRKVQRAKDKGKIVSEETLFKEGASMNTSRPQTKLNAKMGLIVTSILYLVNAGVGTAPAVKENLPSVTFITSGKPALEDFLTGNGTALSPPFMVRYSRRR